jgi:hypothetical protein
MADTNYTNIDGEISTTPLGYDALLSREGTQGLANDPNTDQTNVLNFAGGINNSNSSAILGTGSVKYDQTTMNVLQVNQDMQSSNWVSLTTGWKIWGNGDAEFANLTLVRGTFKYGKTSFTDAVHAGYILDTNGIYMGSAGDTTYLKYTIAAATMT